MAFQNPPDDVVREILAHPRVIAVVGCSPDQTRDSNRIASLLIERGRDVIPVNPSVNRVFGRRSYTGLREIQGSIDVVDIFRRSEHVSALVDDAIAVGAKIVWTQLGIGDENAAERAQRAGLTVVMNRCPAIEYARLFPS